MSPDPMPIEPDEAHPFAAFGVRVGLTAGRLKDGAVVLGVGERFAARAQGQRLGVPGTYTAFRHEGNEWQWPLPDGLACSRVGPQEAAFVVDNDVVSVPLLVEGPLEVQTAPLWLLATSNGQFISDNQIGVLPDPGAVGWYYYVFSSFPGMGEGLVTTFHGQPDNPHGDGVGLTAKIEGAPADALNFGGPCHRDPDTGAWLMQTLHQWPLGAACYGAEGVAVSTDNGANWRWGGLMSAPAVSYAQAQAHPEDYGQLLTGGGSLLYVANADGDEKDYYYGYPAACNGVARGPFGDPAQFKPVTAVRAPARELVAGLLAGRDCRALWRKWYQGGWTSPHDGPGDAVLPYGGYGGCQVVWCASRGIWLAIFSGHETWRGVYLSWAPARVGPWSRPQLLALLELGPDWLWGGPAVLSPDGTVCAGRDWFDVALTAWDQYGGTGEIRNLAVRARVVG